MKSLAEMIAAAAQQKQTQTKISETPRSGVEPNSNPEPHSEQELKPQSAQEQQPIEPPKQDKVTEKEFNTEGMTDGFSGEAVERFKDAVKVLHNSFDVPDAVRNSTFNILRGLKENPEFTKILLPDDVQLMVRALRQSYGITVASKVANKEKKTKKAADIDAIGAMLGDDYGIE